jgi:hypothetical protein
MVQKIMYLIRKTVRKSRFLLANVDKAKNNVGGLLIEACMQFQQRKNLQ